MVFEAAAQDVWTYHEVAVCLSHRLCVSEVGSLSMAAAGELRSPVSCISEPDDSMEPYTTERLSRLPGGYKPLTEPFTALNIDFNNVQVSRSRKRTQMLIRTPLVYHLHNIWLPIT